MEKLKAMEIVYTVSHQNIDGKYETPLERKAYVALGDMDYQVLPPDQIEEVIRGVLNMSNSTLIKYKYVDYKVAFVETELVKTRFLCELIAHKLQEQISKYN